MLAPHMDALKTASILEPSAGMGAIADWMCFKGAKRAKINCCEIDDNMKATLTGKGYKVLHGDFLSYSGAMNFDLIIINPPFDRGADHLLKAWDILRNGHIVCLLNEETIKNPYTENRQKIETLISRHGSVEFLGNVFENAARQTDVGVALVRLEKISEYSKASFTANATEAAQDIDLSSSGTSVEKADIIDSLCRSYRLTVNSTEALYRAMKEFQLYAGSFIDGYQCDKICAQFFEQSRQHGYSESHNNFVLDFQRRAWDSIFSRTKVSGLMTAKVREKFDKWRQEMGGVDLNEENIMMIFEALIQQRGIISDECIVEAFDKITYYSEKNRSALGDRYKTNSAYMVASKFILNYIVEVGWNNELSLSYGRGRENLDDIDRALCMVSGKSFDSIKTTSSAIRDWCEHTSLTGVPSGESEFFTFKCYLKGSVHFKFKDEALRKEFNRRACEKKGWALPEEETFRGKARRS